MRLWDAVLLKKRRSLREAFSQRIWKHGRDIYTQERLCGHLGVSTVEILCAIIAGRGPPTLRLQRPLVGGGLGRVLAERKVSFALFLFIYFIIF